MSVDKKNTEEEVDLGSLFIIIGKGFSKFFNFIGSIFKGVFHLLILFLLFIKKHFLKFAISAVIGGAIGFFMEFKKEASYGSDLLVQPNFKSARQLYNNVNYYNDLVKQRDSLSLASTFNISKEKAGTLRNFEITAIINENDIIEAYDELVLSVDTLTVKSYSFSQFKKVFTEYDYKIHKIHVEASDKNIFKNLDDVIISSITKNQYFGKLKTLTNENLYRTDSLLRRNLSQVDSLRKVYMTVMMEEAKKQHQGTSIDVTTEKKARTKELELFETNKTINEDLKEVSEEISEKSEVINVISNFQPVGYEIASIQRNYIFLFSLAAVALMLVFILLMELNRYLETYKK